VNCGAAASEKQILCPSRGFAFSHSQGHFRNSARIRSTSVVHSTETTGQHVAGRPASAKGGETGVLLALERSARAARLPRRHEGLRPFGASDPGQRLQMARRMHLRTGSESAILG
jgi:hypothetical protein